ncbi:glycoside hydrolase family 27 protein [Nocardia niigatensis]
MRVGILSFALVVATALLTADTAAGPARPAPIAAVGGRLTPPMGWNSWNSGIPLTEQNIHEVIDSMVASGMRDAGYRYVNLDAGWAAAQRDTAGNLRADPRRFPHGMAALADYAHARGLYLGLYSSPYNETCGQAPGTAGRGHEIADARTFAGWGVDFLKYDWCRADADLTEEVPAFTAMRDALRASGRRIVYSINPNSSGNLHAGGDYDWSTIADMARNTADLIPLWHNGSPDQQLATRSVRGLIGVTDELGAAEPLARRTRPGYWNDPDMMVVGLPLTAFISAHLAGYPADVLAGPLTTRQTVELESSFDLPPDVVSRLRDPRFSLVPEEERAHFSLWAMLAAPLIAGNDVRTMTGRTRALLTNPDVIAVDQDSRVVQATPLPSDTRILTKPLSDGAVAVAVFNPADRPATIETALTALGLGDTDCYSVRNLWTHAVATTAGMLSAADIPAHGVAMFKVSSGCPAIPPGE